MKGFTSKNKEFTNFTFILTEECNFNCSYCYQKREKEYIDISAVEKAIDFFFPYFKKECSISFSGGEPLLAFEQIEQSLNYIQVKNKTPKKQIQYYITTNGSLINENILRFLNQHKFSLMLGFDGLAQDISRKKGSFEHIVSIIKKILESPDINLVTNSVFTPETIGYLSKSTQFIMELDVPNISFSFSNNSTWDQFSLLQLKDELVSLRKFLIEFYKKKGLIPLIDFRKNRRRGIFACFAGKDRMTLAPDGKLWGCHFFHEYLRGREGTPEYHMYCFGDLNSFIKNHERDYPKVLSNYSSLRMDFFYTSETFCIQCPELDGCVVCPMEAVFSSSIIGKISDWTCRIRKIVRKEKELFLEELKN